MPSYHITTSDREYALKLTKQIKEAAEDLWALLLEAWNSKAHVSMGYKTWGAYVDAEFDFKRRYSYRLVNQGQVIKQLREAASHGTQVEEVTVSEREARDIATFGSGGTGAVVYPAVIEHVQEQVAAGVTAEEAVRVAVEAARTEPPRPQIMTQATDCVHEFACRHCGEILQ